MGSSQKVSLLVALLGSTVAYKGDFNPVSMAAPPADDSNSAKATSPAAAWGCGKQMNSTAFPQQQVYTGQAMRPAIIYQPSAPTINAANRISEVNDDPTARL